MKKKLRERRFTIDRKLVIKEMKFIDVKINDKEKKRFEFCVLDDIRKLFLFQKKFREVVTH